MSKQELENLMRQVEAMKAAMQAMILELNTLSIRLRFVPASRSSTESDEDVCDEYTAHAARK